MSLRIDKSSPWRVITHVFAVFVLSILFIVRICSPLLGADQVHDEIQVYNAEIASIGQWTYQQHLNYAAIGQAQPEVPGGFSSNRAYLPFAVNGGGQFLSDGAKIRNLFVVPDAASDFCNASAARPKKARNIRRT